MRRIGEKLSPIEQGLKCKMHPKGKTKVRETGVILKPREQDMDRVKKKKKKAVGLMLTDTDLAQEYIPKQGPNIQAEFGNSTS